MSSFPSRREARRGFYVKRCADSAPIEPLAAASSSATYPRLKRSIGAGNNLYRLGNSSNGCAGDLRAVLRKVIHWENQLDFLTP